MKWWANSWIGWPNKDVNLHKLIHKNKAFQTQIPTDVFIILKKAYEIYMKSKE